ncbi:putative leucine-rich repeat receptor-like protein kinase [Camellia lanceoleosa]|uniref:Leucine-rich repeat receptor-like protein kinase n=1 Tax=Camellia lanceoleosa TaxID=1840588 RepID=A0ACC0IP27_9ERIC|nr:putative leucine-rich repeat receptor-like protein kinase [Camellia lanceoleosa]
MTSYHYLNCNIYRDLSNTKGLTGTLPSLIRNLNQLTTLILIGCSFFGPIPDSIGSLQQLVFLALNANSFSGPIPPSIGNLSNLSWLDLTENQLNGTIPVSSGSTTGLDMLVKARHFKIFDINKLTGSIPDTLGYVQTLEAICFNWNSLNGHVPSNLNNLTSVRELYLSNNNLNGPLPNLTGMNFLNSLIKLIAFIWASISYDLQAIRTIAYCRESCLLAFLVLVNWELVKWRVPPFGRKEGREGRGGCPFLSNPPKLIQPRWLREDREREGEDRKKASPHRQANSFVELGAHLLKLTNEEHWRSSTIFDGHNGSAVAIYSKENLLNKVLAAIPSDLNRDEWVAALPRALVAGFVKTDKDFQEKGMGCFCVSSYQRAFLICEVVQSLSTVEYHAHALAEIHNPVKSQDF